MGYLNQSCSNPSHLGHEYGVHATYVYAMKITQLLTLPMLRLLSSKAKDANSFDNSLNPVMLVFIG